MHGLYFVCIKVSETVAVLVIKPLVCEMVMVLTSERRHVLGKFGGYPHPSSSGFDAKSWKLEHQQFAAETFKTDSKCFKLIYFH